MPVIPGRSRKRDGCAVETARLAELIEQFAARRGSVMGIHPLAWLSERTRDVCPHGAGISRRQILRLLKRERPLTDLRVADALLVAMRNIEPFYDGTLLVVERKPGCCRVYDISAVGAALACRD